MAKTLILFIALAVTGVAAFFSFQNLEKMKGERLEIAKLETSIDALLTEISNIRENITDRNTQITDQERTRGARIGERDGLRSDIERAKQEVPALDNQIRAQEQQIATFEGVIDELKKFFQDMDVNNPEELNEKIKQLANDRVAREREVAEVEAAIEAANAEIARLEGLLANARQAQVDRTRGIEVNTRQPEIVAINRDWGFVIVNAGTAQGFKPENSLLVQRGETFVGKLVISSISNNQLVADIVPRSIPVGQSIQPGDRVILQSPNQ